MFHSHEIVQLTIIFYRKRETRNQACNREILTKSFLYNQFQDVINIENNQFSKKLINENDKIFNHTHEIFKSNENEIEVNRINLMNIAKKLKK